jgi:light-regulated signal transduction histidine kinase (bacteriophytochrome)
MSNSEQNHGEIDILRNALEAETQHGLQLRRQLDRANFEFEEFVSTAAHHMRESLRGVVSYSQLLSETCSGRLDTETREFLDHIQNEAVRMQSLLAGVVDYWAVGCGDLQPKRVDMEAVLRQAQLSADKLITERGAIVTHDPLPKVMGDFGTLAKALHELIKNAIEYCVSSTPIVQVSSTQSDLECVFSVADNGPGIEAAFHGRIFGAFKRLHGKEHSGEGLGLAFCKRAIEWHGGRLWVESNAGAGSTFYFSLPAAD